MTDDSSLGPHGLPYQLVEAYSKSQSPDALPKLVRVALYTRVSTPAQMIGEFSAMNKQRFGLEATVAQNAKLNWRITHDFSDGARSGTKRNRKFIKAARMAAFAREYDLLLVGAQARIARDVCFSMQFIEDLERNGVEIWTTTGQRISIKGDNFVATGVTAVMDQHESIRLSERIGMSLARASARGLHACGHPPPGYIRVPYQKMHIMPGEGIEHSREMFLRIAEGESEADIELDFNRQGIVEPAIVICRGKPTERTIRGKPYTRARIGRIIRDVTYMGCVRCKGWSNFSKSLPEPKFFFKGVAIYPGVHQETVTEEAWRKANANLDGRPKLERKPKTADLEGIFIVQGLAECECGETLTTKYVGKANDPKRRNYLVCMSQNGSNRRPTNPCSMPTVPAGAVDDCTVHYLSSLFKHPELLSFGLEGPVQAKEKSLGDLQAELASLRVQINDCSQLYREVKLTAREVLAAQLRALSDKEADTLRRIRTHASPSVKATAAQSATIEELQEAARQLDAAPRCEVKRLIKIWVSKVRVKHATEDGGHIRRFVVSLDLKFNSMPDAPPHVFTIEETARRSGKYHIVAPFVQDIIGAPSKVVSSSSPCYPLVLLEKWKQQLARNGITQKKIAHHEGLSESYVSNVVKLAAIPRQLRDRILRADHPATGYNWLKRLASAPLAEMEWEVARLLDGPTRPPRRRLAGGADTIDSNQTRIEKSPGAQAVV